MILNHPDSSHTKLGINIPLIRVLIKDDIPLNTKFDLFVHLGEIQLLVGTLIFVIALIVILNFIGWLFTLVYMKNIQAFLDTIYGHIKKQDARLQKDPISPSGSSTRLHHSSSQTPRKVQMNDTVQDYNANGARSTRYVKDEVVNWHVGPDPEFEPQLQLESVPEIEPELEPESGLDRISIKSSTSEGKRFRRADSGSMV